MPAHVRTVDVPEADRRELQRRVRDKGAPARGVERARIVLLAGDSTPGKWIAAIVGCAEPTVVTWRGRYAQHGLAGLEDLPRPGKPAQLPEQLRDRVLELTLTVAEQAAYAHTVARMTWMGRLGCALPWHPLRGRPDPLAWGPTVPKRWGRGETHTGAGFVTPVMPAKTPVLSLV